MSFNQLFNTKLIYEYTEAGYNMVSLLCYFLQLTHSTFTLIPTFRLQYHVRKCYQFVDNTIQIKHFLNTLLRKMLYNALCVK